MSTVTDPDGRHLTPRYSGTAFPANPQAGDTFYRTDLGFECTFDGTRWLGPEQLLLMRTTADLFSSAAMAVRGYITSTDGIYITRWDVRTKVADTNSASHFYDVELGLVGTGGAAGLKSFTTAPDAVNTWVARSFNSPGDFAGFLANTVYDIHVAVAVDTGQPGELDIMTRIYGKFVYV